MGNFELKHVPTAEEGAEIVYEIIKQELANDRLHVLGLATGSTMIPVYKKWTDSSLDFTNVTTFNLDEYVGLAPDDPNSYSYFMDQYLFDYKKFKKVHRLNGLAEDLAQECLDYEQALHDYPLDIQLLGVGENGHIAFNEPGTSMDSVTHVAKLTPSTLSVNSRFFDNDEAIPDITLTMGIQSIMRSKKLVLLAFGEKKRAAIEKFLEQEITKEWPITKLLQHNDLIVITDLHIIK